MRRLAALSFLAFVVSAASGPAAHAQAAMRARVGVSAAKDVSRASLDAGTERRWAPPPREHGSPRRWIVTGAAIGAGAGAIYGVYRGYRDAQVPYVRVLTIPVGFALGSLSGMALGGATGFIGWQVAGVAR